MEQYRLEIWGEMCPIPLIKAQKKLKTMAIGDMLIMETEHSCTSQGIVVWAKKNKYMIEETEIDNGIWHLELTKTHT
ncbi:sulfurtransferase TusA family protein [Desulfitobacterium metallireducens]|uniref:Response regulator SirA n=1 Tax=Desulfitobacterium metallireducens DSM 15288 TaxID=871968 RepID=W0EC38_9FIRM|nr:sulfurtransferase TusA family protein [Desulfitobacterium metallireducens]AHF06631.1 response regulator SirA [Desulfitobacterium metallireducens DSM 15288]